MDSLAPRMMFTVHPLAAGFTLPTDPSMYALAAAVIATGYIYVKARNKSRRDPMKNAPPPFSSLAAQRKVENQMTELIVELEKMVRQMNGQLDTRAAKLEELIRQADERLTVMNDMLNDLRTREGETLRLPPAGARGSAMPLAAEEPPPAPIPIDPRHAAVYRLADQGRNAMEIGRELNQPPGEVELILALRRRAR